MDLGLLPMALNEKAKRGSDKLRITGSVVLYWKTTTRVSVPVMLMSTSMSQRSVHGFSTAANFGSADDDKGEVSDPANPISPPLPLVIVAKLTKSSMEEALRAMLAGNKRHVGTPKSSTAEVARFSRIDNCCGDEPPEETTYTSPSSPSSLVISSSPLKRI